MKKIVVDCRYLGLSGIGRYLEGLLDNFDFNKYEYILWGKKELVEKYKNCKYIYDSLSPFSAKSLFKSPTKEINKADILFTPNFIIPYGIKIRCDIILHDVIFLDMPELSNGLKDTLIKKHLIRRGVSKATTIYTVSNFTKERIIHYFKNVENKINVIYADVSNSFKEYDKKFAKENYVIFVGNLKENKGLRYLLEAFNEINDLKLIIVGTKENYRSYDKTIIDLYNSKIEFTGYISDEELKEKIAKARFLIQPSTYEGFGLPPLEAMYLGTKPIISDIEVFKEVYNGFDVIYFENKNSKDLTLKIKNSDFNLNFDKSKALIKFSHKSNAKMIEDIYE